MMTPNHTKIVVGKPIIDEYVARPDDMQYVTMLHDADCGIFNDRQCTCERWAAWSDREIARHCGVHHNFVGKLRKAVTGDISSDNRTYVTKHGTEAVMNTAHRSRWRGMR